jgi:hypothetical protein
MTSSSLSKDEILFGYCAVNASGHRVSPIFDTEHEVIEYQRGFTGYRIQKVKNYFSFYGGSTWIVMKGAA